MEANQLRDNNVNNEESGNFGSQKEINFMKVKKYGEDSKEKKPNVPTFLSKNSLTDMKRSSFELFSTKSNEKSMGSTSSSMLFSSGKIKKKPSSSDF